MTAPDPAATLQALADWLRHDVTGDPDDARVDAALAEHVESVNVGHQPSLIGPSLIDDEVHHCQQCGERYPCTDVRTLLAVAAAAGVTP